MYKFGHLIHTKSDAHLKGKGHGILREAAINRAVHTLSSPRQCHTEYVYIE